MYSKKNIYKMFRILQNSIRKTCKTGIQKLYFKLNFLVSIAT